MYVRRLIAVLALGLALTLLLLMALNSPPQVTRADPGAFYVAPDGDDARDCASIANRCRTIQRALDGAQKGDEILVAAGTYTGVQNVPALNTSTFTATQVAAITKSVTLRGGYTTAFADPPDPEAHRTIVDAEGAGRAMVIIGDAITVTMEGVRITGGDATGLGGFPSDGIDVGGGVYLRASAILRNCVVHSNTASSINPGYGGGMYVYYYDDVTLEGNTIMSNTGSSGVRGRGGGMYLHRSDALLQSNVVMLNTAGTKHGMNHGGGLYLYYASPTLENNIIITNVASTVSRAWAYGGGLYINESAATLEGNIVRGNFASTAARGYGGGVHLQDSDATLKGNEIISNTASAIGFGYGGGLYVSHGSITLINNVVADNHADIDGSGLRFRGASWYPIEGHLLHNTIAHNHGSGQGICVKEYATLTLTNTILAGHTGEAITITAGSTATMAGTLWRNSGLDTGGEGLVISSTNVYSAPLFADPNVWDYHLAEGSPAVDAGVNTDVDDDIDGDSRPQGGGYDLGADERAGYSIYLPLVLR